MIAIDTSVLIAILGREPEMPAFAAVLSRSVSTVISTATMVETCAVVGSRWKAVGVAGLRQLLAEVGVEYRAVDEVQMQIAIVAYDRFGKGSGHRAQLNYGDCFSYALAKSLDAPLLFKGDDFVHTDIRPALIP